MPRRWPKLILPFGLVLALAGCVEPREMPIWSLAGEPGLLWDVKRHYERHAMEEHGRCLMPQFEGVTRYVVLEETDERMVLALGYFYTDFARDGDDCSRFRPARCFIMRECRGFGERTFTVDLTPERPEIVAMSGPTRRPYQP